MKKEKYYELKNDIKITQTVLKEESENEISAKRTRLKKISKCYRRYLRQ